MIKLYTVDEIFTLLANVSCLKDVQMIADYIHENRGNYSIFDYILFVNSIHIYLEVLL